MKIFPHLGIIVCLCLSTFASCGKKYVHIKDVNVPIMSTNKVIDYANPDNVFECLGEESDLYIIEYNGNKCYVDKNHCIVNSEAGNAASAEDEANDDNSQATAQGTNAKQMVTIKGEAVRVRSTPSATEDSKLLKTYTKQCASSNGGTVTVTYRIADQNDAAKVYAEATNKDNCYFVISKIDYRLYVYEVSDNGVKLLAHYPMCYAKRSGPKEGEGDMKTPECVGNTPFEISEIKDASSWSHDFGDGRGDFPAYGAWFMRLRLNGSPLVNNRSIGIHGSTNNAESVPGQDSEGCIRLRDADIKQLKEKYAKVGTKVYIRSNKMSKSPKEQQAVKDLGSAYCAPQPGNPLLK